MVPFVLGLGVHLIELPQLLDRASPFVRLVDPAELFAKLRAKVHEMVDEVAEGLALQGLADQPVVLFAIDRGGHRHDQRGAGERTRTRGAGRRG